ncbi:MAG: aldo/keto reductase, partial [Propionibacteriaceae bacterium]|nr:aldo/keto reductase [Propionibacteriaceae bacterium]
AEAGHTRYLGLSEASVDQIERCNRIHPVSSVQTELSLFSRGALDDVVPYCLEHDIVFIAYAPLSRGLLPGQITSDTDLDPDDMRRGSQRLSTPVMSANTESIIDPIRQYADELGLTPSQVALAWVLAQGDNIAAIPGTQHLNHLEENMRAASVTLTKEWLARFNNLPQAAGNRY